MTAADLSDMLTTALTRKHGGSQRRWRAVLGTIRVHDPRTHPHCNWSAAPSGTAAEIDAVEELLDDVRLRHPMADQA